MGKVELKGNNLYRNGIVMELTDGEGILTREKFSIQATEEDSYHKVTTEEELTTIAYKWYSDQVADASKYWWIIADANDIQNPLDISEYVGQTILIPNILNILVLLD